MEDLIVKLNNRHYHHHFFVKDNLMERLRFMDINNHKYFLELTNLLLPKELFQFVIEKEINDKLYTDPYRKEKMEVIINILMQHDQNLLYSPLLMRIVVEEDINIKDYNIYFNNCYYIFLLSSNNIDPLKILYLSDEAFEYSFNSHSFSRFSNVHNDVLSMSNEYNNRIINLPINTLVGGLKNGFIINKNIIKNNLFINKILSIQSPNQFRKIMDSLELNNMELYNTLNKKRKKQYEEMMDYAINNNGILPYYNKNNITDKDYVENNKILFEILIDRYFEDIGINFYFNIKQILNYIDDLDNSPIPESRLNIYKSILTYNDLPFNIQYKLYSELKSVDNITELFYQDYRLCKNISYTMLHNKIKKIDVEENESLSSLFEVPVYLVKNKPFYMLIHAAKDGIADNSLKLSSLSLINNKSITNFAYANSLYRINRGMVETTKKSKQYVVFGYNNYNIDQVTHVFHTDSFSNCNDGTNKVNLIYSPEKLIEKTEGYNEIVYLNYFDDTNKSLSPDYILCYDTISNMDLLEAKKYNIPIYLLNTSFCIMNNNSITYDDNDRYYDYNDADSIEVFRLGLKNGKI